MQSEVNLTRIAEEVPIPAEVHFLLVDATSFLTFDNGKYIFNFEGLMLLTHTHTHKRRQTHTQEKPIQFHLSHDCKLSGKTSQGPAVWQCWYPPK